MQSEPRIALVIVTDGRGEYLERTVASIEEHLHGIGPRRVIVDDSGDHEYALWMHDRFPEFAFVHHSQRRGLAAAVKTAWAPELASADSDFLWHHEEDFTLNADVDASIMADLLIRQPHLAQLVLKRQPWSREEVAAGGQIEIAPDEYEELSDGDTWVEHSRLFSLNPCLIPRRVLEACRDAELERGITDACLAKGWRFAYWGGRADPPIAHHIGERRSAGYRW